MKKIYTIPLGIILAFLIGAILLAFQGFSPLISYVSMFKNSLLTPIAAGNTLVRMAILLVIGLSAYFGFNSGVNNLGLFGQLLSGALVATLIGQNLKIFPQFLLPFMLISAAIAGGLIAGIAALLWKWFNMNEFITTLMMNFMVDFFVAYLITYPMRDAGSQWPMSAPIERAGVFPKIGFIDLSVIVAFLIYALIFIHWTYTRQGYEYRMAGINNQFAQLGGCRTEKNYISAMMISGELAGIAGAFLIMGSTQQNKLIPSLGKSNSNDGLMIAIISGNSLLSVLIFSLFFGMIQTGAVGMQMDTNVPNEFTMMLQAVMVLFVVAFRDYADVFVSKLNARDEARKLEAKK